MGNSLSVEHQKIGLVLQQFPRCQHCRPFAEGQQSGNIRKNQRCIRGHCFERGELWKADQYDRGPIILQRCVPVLDDDTAETLAARVLALEHELYPEAIQLFAENRLRVDGRRVRIRPPPGA